MKHSQLLKAIPRIIDQKAFNVRVCFVDGRHKVDTVSVRWNTGSAPFHHVLNVLHNVIHLHINTHMTLKYMCCYYVLNDDTEEERSTPM